MGSIRLNILKISYNNLVQQVSTGDLKYFTGYPQLGQDHDVRSDRPTGRSDKIMKNRPSGDFIHILGNGSVRVAANFTNIPQ